MGSVLVLHFLFIVIQFDKIALTSSIIIIWHKMDQRYKT
jgi:hypothetical protein